MRRRSFLGSFGFAVCLSSVAVAAAMAATAIGPATKFSARFSTKRTATPTGLTLHTAGKPPRSGDSEAPAVRQTVILPLGTKLTLGRLPQCRASDSEISSQGAEGACPSRSRVGHGSADGTLNGAPVHFDIGIYAVRGHLVFAAEQNGKPLKQSFNGVAQGRRLLLTVPTLGGAIDPTAFFAAIPARPGGRAWLLTPPSCPRSRKWTVIGRFQGVSSTDPGAHPVTPAQQLVDRDACRR